MFIGAIYNSQDWKQLKCPMTEGGIRNWSCTYTMEYYSTKKIFLQQLKWNQNEAYY